LGKHSEEKLWGCQSLLVLSHDDKAMRSAERGAKLIFLNVHLSLEYFLKWRWNELEQLDGPSKSRSKKVREHTCPSWLPKSGKTRGFPETCLGLEKDYKAIKNTVNRAGKKRNEELHKKTSTNSPFLLQNELHWETVG